MPISERVVSRRLKKGIKIELDGVSASILFLFYYLLALHVCVICDMCEYEYALSFMTEVTGLPCGAGSFPSPLYEFRTSDSVGVAQ